ncbi:MAG TPA: cbb3-type cytochrome oxidase assembly protein CcoS [Pirellulaceae bacterium]|nr:cbb3-type cytochrome oxidase assembly protein CcoS [Pirellulaceae bacterium]
MSVIFIALPVALLLALSALAGFVLAARQGQFDDLETPPLRVLFDDREVVGTPLANSNGLVKPDNVKPDNSPQVKGNG